MSTGLMGATGTLDVDGLTVQLVPVGWCRDDQPDRQRRLRAGRPGAGLLDRQGRASGLPGQRLAGRPGADACPGVRHGRRWRCRSTASTGWTCRSRPDARACAARGGAMATFYFLDRYGRDIEPPGQQIGAARPELGGDVRLAGPERPGARAAGRGPGRAPDREARRYRLDPDRRRPGHGRAQRPGRRLDPVPRRRRHRRLAPGGGLAGDRRRRRRSTSRSWYPSRPAASGW